MQPARPAEDPWASRSRSGRPYRVVAGTATGGRTAGTAQRSRNASRLAVPQTPHALDVRKFRAVARSGSRGAASRTVTVL
ncbi:hypothetical protein GCM10027612_23350 [Microbispora bryophytorum subsp. camponoti]